MRERTVAVPTEDGQMETFITHPEDGGPFPAIVLYMDFWGVRKELFDIARRVGTVGYYCVVPDLYYRQGRVRHAWYNENGRMISAHRLDPKRRRQAGGTARAAVERDGYRGHRRIAAVHRWQRAGAAGWRRLARVLHRRSGSDPMVALTSRIMARCGTTAATLISSAPAMVRWSRFLERV